MLELTDSTRDEHDNVALQGRLREEGYLFLRQALPSAAVHAVRKDIYATLEVTGWLALDADLDQPRPSAQACPESGDPDYIAWYQRLQSLQSYHELAHDDRLVALVERVLDCPALVHPRKIARASLPSSESSVPTPPHQDFPLIQGSSDTLTCWLPFGPCPTDLGGLRVLQGSAQQGLRKTRPARGAGGIEIDDDLIETSDRWRASRMEAGDVLLFHSFTIHGALPNRTDTLRLSADFRYQRASDPVLDLSLQPHYADDLAGYEVLTAGWTSTASVDAPPGLTLTSMVDPLDPDLTAPEARLLASS